MPLTPAERSALKARCEHVLHGFTEPAPAETFAAMARWCETHAAVHDVYGEGDLVARFEHKLAQIVGKAAALVVPSGVMAQLIALRIWTERAALPRFAMHATAHLEHHEEKAYEALLGFTARYLGEAHRPVVADDLNQLGEPVACALIELPLREIGGQLPSWSELEELKRAAQAARVPLHMDGARLWETRAFYDKPYEEIARGFDSVYVSLYKGIGALSGAVLLGDEEFIANARIWRRRFGGTLVHQSPAIVSAALQLDERLALMPALYARTVSLAETLNRIPGITTLPRIPQSNMLHLFFDVPAEALLEARDAFATEHGVWLFNQPRPADEPGRCRTEIYVGDRALELSDLDLARWFTALLAPLRGG